MVLASFTLMTTEILLIFLFQATLGYLYSKIALLFTTILVSMGVGNLLTTNLKEAKKALTLSKILILLYLVMFFFLIKNLDTEREFYLLGGLMGVLVGTIFPLTNKVYLTSFPKPSKKTGVLYASDLFGAFLGALFPSILFIPVFGVQKTVLLLALLNLFSF